MRTAVMMMLDCSWRHLLMLNDTYNEVWWCLIWLLFVTSVSDKWIMLTLDFFRDWKLTWHRHNYLCILLSLSHWQFCSTCRGPWCLQSWDHTQSCFHNTLLEHWWIVALLEKLYQSMFVHKYYQREELKKLGIKPFQFTSGKIWKNCIFSHLVKNLDSTVPLFTLYLWLRTSAALNFLIW